MLSVNKDCACSIVSCLISRRLEWQSFEVVLSVNKDCACSIVSCLISRRLEWQSFEVVLSGRKTIDVRNVTNEAREKLEFRDRIIKISLSFQHLIVATSSQCYIYR